MSNDLKELQRAVHAMFDAQFKAGLEGAVQADLDEFSKSIIRLREMTGWRSINDGGPEDPDDRFVMPMGLQKGEMLKDIPMKDIEGLLTWIEEKDLGDKFEDLCLKLSDYLTRNGYYDASAK